MPKHPFDIKPNGDVLYKNTFYYRTAVKALIRQLKIKLENQREAVGHYLGYVVEFRGKSYSHLKIGCESFDTRTIQAFIEDYENRPSVLHVCLGDRLIRTPKNEYGEAGQEYLVACVGYHSAQLISLSDGNRWAKPVTCTNIMEPITLNELVGEEYHEFINEFSIKEK